MANEQNLIPFKPGQSGNPKGKKPGTKNLSTIVRDILESELEWDKIPINRAGELAKRYHGTRGWDALVYIQIGKAFTGDSKAVNFLRKAGYGDKITHVVDEGLFTSGSLKIEIVNPVTEDDRYVS